ncbi:MAG: NAD(P)-dependent oxidoreductase [Candidatus Shapirobacteria bacterium]|nr:NAD(P)-dependent oxidoreductase [Candidatus Shapirobacteria bacterium]
MKKLNILLTGGSGFIGKNILEQRKEKYNIIAPSHDSLDLLDTETVDNFFEENKIDIVIHCANIGGLRSDLNVDNMFKDNLKMFFNIIKNKDKVKKIISLGSGAEYDKSSDIKEVRESKFDLKIPKDNYGFYKYICSKYIENSSNIYCLRLFGIFGKYEDYRVKFISNIICKYIYKQPLNMIQDAYFDYLYIDDFVKILDFFINTNPKFNIYNIGTGKRISLLSIAKKINNLDKYSLKINVQKKGLNKEYTCNNKRLVAEFNNINFTKIEDSLVYLYNYYKQSIDTLDKRSILKDKYNKL